MRPKINPMIADGVLRRRAVTPWRALKSGTLPCKGDPFVATPQAMSSEAQVTWSFAVGER
jgi:hypothetical protein